MDDFQKATQVELKARFTDLMERNERLEDLIEIDLREITALKALVREMGDCLQFYATRGGGKCQEILNRTDVRAIMG